jgi:hypothetical protein
MTALVRPLRAAVLALVMMGLGCAMQPVDARTLTPAVPQPTDTRRIEIPLYIILDPVKLPEAMIAQGQGVKPIEVNGLHAFVQRDLQKALSQVFASVTVAPPSAPAPTGLFFTGEVLVSSLSTYAGPPAPGSTTAGAYPRMQWSLHIRAYGAPADAFVYQGTAQAKVAVTSVRETAPAFQSLFEDALVRLIAHLDAQKAYDRLSRTGR